MVTAAAERARPLLADLRRIFGDRLRSLSAYGDLTDSDPLTCLALVHSLDVADLDACAQAATSWRRQGLATPLIMSEHEFHRSLDAFPLEYSEIQRTYTRLHGVDPFDGVEIASGDLRRALETLVKSLLLHLREEYIHAAGSPQQVAALVRASAAGFATLLRNVARLHGSETKDAPALTREGARIAGINEKMVASVLELEHPSGVASTDPARLFPEYVVAVGQLATVVDRWRIA